jgi:hypothetical protein
MSWALGLLFLHDDVNEGDCSGLLFVYDHGNDGGPQGTLSVCDHVNCEYLALLLIYS